MKKKTLLLTLLALAIVTSLTAGTLAVYTKSVDLKDSTVQIKKFVFNAELAPQWQTADIKFAPGESRNYSFDVSNHKDGSIAEIPLDFRIDFNFTDADLKMKGLTPTLTKNGDKVEIPGSGGINAYVSDKESPMKANEKLTDKYVLTLTWVDDGNNNSSHTDAGLGATSHPLKIKVTATQNTTKTPANP